jgi:hypothetical protein
MIHNHTTTTNTSTTITTLKTNPGSFLLWLQNNNNPTQDNKALYNYTINMGKNSKPHSTTTPTHNHRHSTTIRTTWHPHSND